MFSDSSGSGGLGDISYAKERLQHPNGFQEQMEANKKQQDLRIVSGFFILLVIGTLVSWLTGMPSFIKYGCTSVTILSVITYLLMILQRKRKLEKLREVQLREHIESKTIGSTPSLK
ncbi:MAG: hypothetical protein ACPF9K_04565 [Neptuniibacter sp.]